MQLPVSFKNSALWHLSQFTPSKQIEQLGKFSFEMQELFWAAHDAIY